MAEQHDRDGQEGAPPPRRLGEVERPRGEPPRTMSDPKELLAGYLDYYRATVLQKLAGLGEVELRGSRLPSGWSPLELLWHLTHVERRWLVWGFDRQDVAAPWGDHDAAGRWRVPEGMSAAEVVRRFEEQCARSRQIVGAAGLADRASTGGRFDTEAEAPALSWILLHLLQEYARHAGHLDIARELADGRVGE